MKRFFSKLTITTLCATAILTGAYAETQSIVDIGIDARTDYKVKKYKDMGKNTALKEDKPNQFETDVDIYLSGRLPKNDKAFYNIELNGMFKTSDDNDISFSKWYAGYNLNDLLTIKFGKMGLNRGGFEDTYIKGESFAVSFLADPDNSNTVASKFAVLDAGVGLAAEIGTDEQKIFLSAYNGEEKDKKQAPGFALQYHGMFVDGILELMASYHNLTSKYKANPDDKDAANLFTAGIRGNLLDKTLVTELDLHHGTNKLNNSDKDKVTSATFNTLYRVDMFRPFAKLEYAKVKNGNTDSGNRKGIAVGNIFYLTEDDALKAHLMFRTYTDSKEINAVAGKKGTYSEINAGLSLAI